MKKIVAVTLLATMLVKIGYAQKLNNQFVLKGKLKGLTSGLLYLYYANNEDARIKDSSQLLNGNFSFKGNISHPTIAYLQLKENKRNESNSTNFFLEPTVITVNLKFNEFRTTKITGLTTQNEYAQLEVAKLAMEAKYKKQLDSLSSEKDHENNAEIRDRLAPYFSEMDQLDIAFVRSHPQSYVTVYLMRFHVADLSIDSLQAVYDRLGKELQQIPDGKTLAEEIQRLRYGSPGSPANNFTATDINGNSLSLSDFKGKYVLLDFWASWCVPCRKGNPHLKELYAKYKDKGIEFIGISDDDSKPDVWRKAVEKDGLPWRHVLRGLDMQKILKGEKNESDINEKFGIHELPTKILIDPTGMIIGRFDEKEEEMDTMLKKIFGE